MGAVATHDAFGIAQLWLRRFICKDEHPQSNLLSLGGGFQSLSVHDHHTPLRRAFLFLITEVLQTEQMIDQGICTGSMSSSPASFMSGGMAWETRGNGKRYFYIGRRVGGALSEKVSPPSPSPVFELSVANKGLTGAECASM